MSVVVKPNIYIKASGRLQESYIIKNKRLSAKRLAESKELVDRVHPENEEYSAPDLSKS